MDLLIMREALPDRRRSWTRHVRIDGHSFYMGVGLYEDGRLGEIWLDTAKDGTFLRGVMGDLARTISIMLQCGAGVETAIYTLKGHYYPPCGQVEGSPNVQYCESVTDWIAQELEAEFLNKVNECDDEETVSVFESAGVPAPPKKSVGYISKNVWG